MNKCLKSVTVKFWDDNLIEPIIGWQKNAALPSTDIQEDKLRDGFSPLRSTRVLSPLHEDDGLCDAEADFKLITKPKALIEEKNGTEKSSPFGFHTPKKRKLFDGSNTHSPLAESGRTQVGTPRTPTTPQSQVSKRASSRRTPKRDSVERSTPSHWSGRGCRTRETPRALRRTVKNTIKKMVCDEDSSSSNEEDLDSDAGSVYDPSDSMDDSDKENESSQCKFRTPLRGFAIAGPTPIKRTSNKKSRRREHTSDELAGTNDAYFERGDASESWVTSDHVLNKLEVPRLAPDALRKLVSDYETHPAERTAMLEELRDNFGHWMTLLCEGHSVFLCGVGSKKNILSEFQKEMLSDQDHIVVNGFFPSLMVKAILSSILEDILDQLNYPQNPTDQLSLIGNILSANNKKVFVVVHNLDGPMIRGAKSQKILSSLAGIRNVSFIASLDHVNGPLIFDSSSLSNYKPVWFDSTTFAPYAEETSYENSLLVQQTGALALSSLMHVFKSLTPNAKDIFMNLARHMVEQKASTGDRNVSGLSFGDLYQRCRKQFLISSDLTLRAQLTEFKDHQLVRSRKSYDGTEILYIPLDLDALTDFVRSRESE